MAMKDSWSLNKNTFVIVFLIKTMFLKLWFADSTFQFFMFHACSTEKPPQQKHTSTPSPYDNPRIAYDQLGHVKLPQVSNEKNPGCFGYIGDYTTQLYRDYIQPL